MNSTRSPWQKWKAIYSHRPRLTLLGRSALLLGSELIVNAVCWIIAGILFGRNAETRSILSLALLAWTIGLRHALDADHIRYSHVDCAIDNATRSLIGQGQLPVTCGLFFSLGHSTIVITVNVAIAISTSVYDHIDGVGTVGGIVGTAVSGSFLFIIGLANSFILWKVLAKRRRMKAERARRIARGEDVTHFDQEVADEEGKGSTLMMRIIGPIVTFVNTPWKMYPVGVLFGFGFDTASSIALLAVSAIAKKDSSGHQIHPGYIVILPLLFTAGMTLIDSVDSIIMLYSYSGFPDRSFALFERHAHVETSLLEHETPGESDIGRSSSTPSKSSSPAASIRQVPTVPHGDAPPSPDTDSMVKMTIEQDEEVCTEEEEDHARLMRVKSNAMSSLSILLTLMSIFVAFAIAIIEIMGLIGDNCTPCQDAANDPNGGGLAGSWWRAWDKANDVSGYIGAAIVGAFVSVVAVSYGSRWAYRRMREKRIQRRMVQTDASAIEPVPETPQL